MSLLGRTPQIAAGVAEQHQSSPVVTSVNAYLINTWRQAGDDDSGAGPTAGRRPGRKLVDILRAAGWPAGAGG